MIKVVFLAATLGTGAAVCLCPAAAGDYCHCSAGCVCGCQSGGDCTCKVGGKSYPPRTKPAATKEAEKEPAKDKAKELDKPGVVIPDEAAREPFIFGVDKTKLDGSGRTHYKYNGREISREKALELIEKGLPDDSHKLRLTIFGTEAEQKRVLDDLKGPLKGLAEHCLVQSYAPDSVMIRDLGFVMGPTATIYLQRPDGVVLHRSEYDGPERLAVALRKSDPNYDPSRDPDLSRPKPKPKPDTPDSPNGGGGFPDLSTIPIWVWGLVAAGVFLLMRREEKPAPPAPPVRRYDREDEERYRGSF